MQKITPHLWFDTQAKEAAEFYVSVFGENSKVTNSTVLHDTPSGDAGLVDFNLWGYEFKAISAGPYFTFNPSISFMVNFDPSKMANAKETLNNMYKQLAEGGKELMPLGSYGFSELYGWIQDKYGLSWQLILTKSEGEERPPIMPSLMFVGDNTGKAQEATDFYMSLFKDSKRGTLAHYPPDMQPDKESSVMFTDFTLANQWFVAMDSGRMHDFNFNEAVSLMVSCKDQEEIDYYWEKLSAVPESEQCGWLKDMYGVSWQIVPENMSEIMGSDPARIARVTQAFLKMKKFDLAKLQEAADASN